MFSYVWQGKGLRAAENGILARFSDVWQGKELAPKVAERVVGSEQ